MDIICDIDGTLMDIEARRLLAVKMKGEHDRIMNWDIFLDSDTMKNLDIPNQDVVKTIRKLASGGDTIIFTSARNERHRKVTLFQIQKKCHMEGKYRLYLRADDDFRADSITKKELYEQIKKDGFNPELAFDDRNQVVEMWRGLGLPCYQVRAGHF